METIQVVEIENIAEVKYPLTKIDPIAKITNALSTKFENVTYDVTTTKGMSAAKADRAELRGLRIQLEDARKDEKADVLAKGRFIDKIAKELEAMIRKYEDPLDEKIKTYEAHKEVEKQSRLEAETRRVDGIQAKIDILRNTILSCAGKTSSEIDTLKADLQNTVVTDEEFEEFKEVALMTLQGVIVAVTKIYFEKVAQEQEESRLKSEREELERQKREQERLVQEANIRRRDEEEMARAARDEEDRKIRESQEAERRKIEVERAKVEAERLENERKGREAQAAAEKKQAEEEARKAKIIQKIQAIRDLPYVIDPFVDTSREVEALIKEVSVSTIIEGEYQEYMGDAIESKGKAILRLEGMLKQIRDREAQETRIKAEQEEAARKQREQKAIEEENSRQGAEIDRLKHEEEERVAEQWKRLNLLKEARRDSAGKALADILSLANDLVGNPNHGKVRFEIALIAEGTLTQPEILVITEPKKKGRKKGLNFSAE